MGIGATLHATRDPSQFADRKTFGVSGRIVAGAYLVALLVAACLLTVVLAGIALVAIIMELHG